MHEIIRLGLVDEEFIRDAHLATTRRWSRLLREYPPERGEQITGVNADLIRRWREPGARPTPAIIFWGMGISQHTTGTDNARCLIAMCAITGNVGRPGSGLHPLRGQNNVQGASDVRADPDVLSRLPAA